jgi:hypothetical protein
MGKMLSDRELARQRLQGVCQKLLDKYIPADEKKPVKDGLFREWEDLADEFDRQMTGAFLEEMVRLSSHARQSEAGACPHCQSANTKWLESQGQRERRSNHGVVVLPRQVARCRSCGRSFSPSGAAVAAESQRASDAQGPGKDEPHRGGAAL